MFAAIFAIVGGVHGPALAQSDFESRFGIDFNHQATPALTVNVFVGYRGNDSANIAEVHFPSLGYKVAPWIELWGGLYSLYSDERGGGRLLELRPFAGVKLMAPWFQPVRLSNYTRFEYRHRDPIGRDGVEAIPRIRSLFAVDFPLSAHAFKPETFYTQLGVEIFHRFDKGGFFERIEPRGRIGYIVNDWLKVEFTYRVVFSRNDSAGVLARGTDIAQFGLSIDF